MIDFLRGLRVRVNRIPPFIDFIYPPDPLVGDDAFIPPLDQAAIDAARQRESASLHVLAQRSTSKLYLVRPR